MKWGVRRYQNKDGTLTPAGKKRYDWGVRKADKLANKTKTLSQKRSSIKENKGVANSSYIKTSKKYYLTKSKLNLQKAKNENDTVKKTLAKMDIKEAKHFKKHGTGTYFASYVKKVYGSNLSKNELNAIQYLENQRGNTKGKILRTLSILSATVPPIIAATKSPQFQSAVKAGKNFVSTVDWSTVRYSIVEKAFVGKKLNK
jgi:hypothetical protein